MIDYLLHWITRGELSGFSPDELAMHERYTDYFLMGIAICLALLYWQFKEIKEKELK